MLRTFACSSLATRRQFLFRSLFGAAFGAFCLNVDSTAAAEEANAFLGKETVLLLPPGKDNPRNSEGDFIRLKTGEILFVYTRYYASSANDDAPARLVSRIADSEGRNWSSYDALVLENEGRLNVMSVTLLRFTDDSIALFYLVKDAPGDCRPYLRVSRDEGKTWSERTSIIDDPTYNVLNNSRVVILSNGRILVPVARHGSLVEGQFQWDSKALLSCYISDDQGVSWKQSDGVPNPFSHLFQEPGVVELADGRILMTIRNQSGRQLFSYSQDAGETWSIPTPSSLVSPLSPASIKRLPQSDLLVAVWNESPKMRDPLALAILDPKGEKILAKRIIDAADGDGKRGFCYPALFFLNQTSLLVGYCNGDGAYALNSSKIIRVDLSVLVKEAMDNTEK